MAEPAKLEGLDTLTIMQLEFPHNFVWWLVVLGGVAACFVGVMRQLHALSLFWRSSPGLVPPVSSHRLVLKAVLIGTALMLLGIAVLGPCWGKQALPRAPSQVRDLLVVLDVSRSMLCEDAPPNRLDRAKSDLSALAKELERRGGWRLGLIAFADRAAVLCPLTTDFDHFQEALRESSLETLRLRADAMASERGTNLAAALARTQAALPKSHDDEGPFADVLLVSDGGDDFDPPARKLAEDLAQAGVRVFAVGVGDPRRASPIPLRDEAGRKHWLTHRGETVLVRLEPDPLREVARLTSGAYLAAETMPLPISPTVDLLETAPRRQLDSVGVVSQPIARYRWFAFPAFLLLLVESWIRISRRSSGANDSAVIGRSRWLVAVIRPPKSASAERKPGVAAGRN